MKRKKQKHEPQSAVPSASADRIYLGLWITLIAVVILAGIPFALGKFFEFNQPDPFDGGAYAYSAWHVLQGAKLFKEELVSAQPATFMVNYLGAAMCGFSETGTKIIQMVLQLAALTLMFFTLRKYFGRVAAVIGVTIASIYLSAPVIAKFGNVKEQYMIAFMVFTVCALMHAMETQKKWLWLAVGAAVMWPYYFKPTGLSIIGATGITVVLLAWVQRWSRAQFLSRLLLVTVGAVAGLCPMLLFFQALSGWPKLYESTPIKVIEAIFVLLSIAYIIEAFMYLCRRYQIITRVKTISSLYWKAALAAIVLAYILGIVIIRIQPGYRPGDVGYYLNVTPFFDISQRIYWRTLESTVQFWESLGTNNSYITGSRALMGFAQQAPIVLRYLGVLCLPVAMAILSILIVLFRLVLRNIRKIRSLAAQDWMGVFLAIWWFLDFAMIWVSPRAYEQYFLPISASSAMLGGYAVWQFMTRFDPASSWVGKILAPVALVIMTAMVWPIFAGITHSPFSGQAYGQRSRGYVQIWDSIRNRQRSLEISPWEQIGDYIRDHSTPQDKIYVWGWYPGIYVRAQRLSASPRAFESDMHILSLGRFEVSLKIVLEGFAGQPPQFIVDSRKREFPWNVPPMELWPTVPKEFQGKWKGFLSTNPTVIEQYEKGYAAFLEKKASPQEAQRFMAMKPLRDYVMQNYDVVKPFGQHVLFVRKPAAAGQ